ncbi:MAG: signal peptidase II [Dehalococcoidia bacterium]|nr:signal peptidase II [Dehalococcoidia bacterium]
MPSALSRSFLLFLVCSLVIVFDQVSKFLIRHFMTPGESIPAEGLFRITYTTNTGGAFGLFANHTFLLAAIAVIGIIIFAVYLKSIPLHLGWLKVGLGLSLGGAIGNLVDRLRIGEVTDFIDLGFWPVFNLADSAIVVGTIVIAYYLIFLAGRTPNRPPQPDE